MRWSFSIGKIFGIDFRIHVTFLVLLFFIFFSGLNQKGLDGALRAVLFVLAIFACVLIHELAHSLIARRFGKEAKSITLLPIGGMATMEEIPDKPGQEVAMAVVGPLINLAIALILYISVGHWTGVGAPNLYPDSARTFVAGLIGVNIMLAIFNLIPAFPMDGGRVLRGLLAMRMNYVRATSAAVFVGQAMSMLFIFFGIFFNWWLTIIGVFIYMGAGSEKQQVMFRSALHRVIADDVMATEFHSLRPNEKLSQALEHIYHGFQQDFPIVGDSGLEGILTRERILSAIHDMGVEVSASEVMDRDYNSVTPQTRLDDVYSRLHSTQKTAAVVMEGSKLRGILSLENISRYLMIQSALKR